ncbi:MAG: hypothetical protein WC052_04415 [Patescibacteria group bacterium]
MSSELLTLKNAIRLSSQSHIFGCIEDLQESDWTEQLVLELIERLSFDYLDDLLDHIPATCKTYKVWREFTVQCPKLLEKVPTKMATQSFYEDVVVENAEAISHVPLQNRTTKLCRIAIERSPIPLLCHVPYGSQTEEMILASIDRHDGEELMAAAFQTRNICMVAIEIDPTSIEWIKDQTLEICEKAIRVAAAVRRGGREKTLLDVVVSIRDHTPKICNLILHFMPQAIAILRNHSQEVCINAIQISSTLNVPRVLKDIREQSLEVCIAAFRKERLSYYAIRDTTMRQRVVRHILTTDALIPLRGVYLSTSLLTEVCEQVLIKKFTPIVTENPQLLTPAQLWTLAAKVKHAK